MLTGLFKKLRIVREKRKKIQIQIKTNKRIVTILKNATKNNRLF